VGGGCRECLSTGDREAACIILQHGPPRILGRDSPETWEALGVSLARISQRIVANGKFSETLGRMKECGLTMSTFLKSLTITHPSAEVLPRISAILSECLRRETSGIYFETDNREALARLMVIGVLINDQRIASACEKLSSLDLESRKRDGVYISEAADLVSKSSKAFCTADKVSAVEAQNEFKLFIASMGSKQRLAVRSVILWSLSAAMNSFFTARALSS